MASQHELLRIFKEFAAQAEQDLSRLDIVILNARVFGSGFNIVPETGHENSVQVNYLSTMLLSILLLPVLKIKSPEGYHHVDVGDGCQFRLQEGGPAPAVIR